MQPGIETLHERKLIGIGLSMTLTDDRTSHLWRSFMPRRKEITNNVGGDLFSLQVYPPSFDFTSPDMQTAFEKWAAVEVSDFESVPEGMERITLSTGLYAVFDYKGLSTDTTIFQYIFGTWLPGSKKYSLDNRPHFQILGDKYKNNDPASEEEIWIPIKPKE